MTKSLLVGNTRNVALTKSSVSIGGDWETELDVVFAHKAHTPTEHPSHALPNNTLTHRETCSQHTTRAHKHTHTHTHTHTLTLKLEATLLFPILVIRAATPLDAELAKSKINALIESVRRVYI